MKTQTKQKSKARIKRLEKVWTPDAELLIPHENEYVNFAYPSIGPNTYLNVGKQILEKNLQIPTGEQTASLLYTAYCDDSIKDEPEFENIRNIIKTDGYGFLIETYGQIKEFMLFEV